MVRVREWAGSHAKLIDHELREVLAIEEQARAAALEEVAEQVRGLHRPGRSDINYRAVLALLSTEEGSPTGRDPSWVGTMGNDDD